MVDEEILKYGEIQYLRGRLDELHKALPTVTNMQRSRKLDDRISKYMAKLKAIDVTAYLQYNCEAHAKAKSKSSVLYRPKYRTNDLSNVEGGYEVFLETKTGEVRVYSNIKFPHAFINKVMDDSKTDVVRFWYEPQ